MKIEIKDWRNGKILFSGNFDSVKEAIEKAISSDANLRGADLINANLSGANLSGANLINANLRGANLSGANLINANLSYADLSGANIDKKWCYFSICPIGSENGNLWVMKNEKGILIYNRGCFSGTEKEFISAVKKKHSGTKHEKEYMAAVRLIRIITNES